MAHLNKVLKSIETDDQRRCVDIFVRPDGTFGFDEFRRDPEDNRGWYPIGFHGDACFKSQEEALTQAQHTVRWLTLV